MINAVLHSKVEEAIRNLDIDEMIDIPTHEISSALTEAQLIMVNNYYASFEINEKARKCLTKLVKPYDSIDNVPFDYIPNATKWELPLDTLYLLKEEALINKDKNGNYTNVESRMNRCIVKPIRLDDYTTNIDNPFKKPYKDVVWRLDISNAENISSILVCDNNTTIKKYSIVYLSKPIDIDIENYPFMESMIHPDFHLELVSMAVDILKQRLINNQIFANRITPK